MPTLGGHEEAISPISGHRGKVNIPSSIGLKKDSKLMLSELDLEPSRCRCHLILLLTCAVAIQGGISCGVIWYIGYRASTSIAQSLSSSIYQSLLSNCVLQINARLALPLQATRELKYHIDNRFPDLSNLLTITNQTGFLADISDIAAKYPILTRMGINTRQGLTVGISRPTSLTNRAYLSDSGFLQVNLAQPATPFAKSVVIDTFIPAASRLPPNRIIYNPPFNITGEILTNDTAESIHYWLGSKRSSSTLNPFTRPYWIAGLELSQRGDSNGWTKIFPTLDIGASSGFIAISALAIELNRNSKELHYVVSSTISLENFNSVLQELPLGQNGKAFLVSSSGHIVSSTESWLIDYLATNRSEFNVWTSQDRLLQSVLNLMHNHKLISSQWTTPTNASLVMHPDAQQYHDSLQLGGQKWHIHMQMMDANSTGLYWTIVVVTLDRDFTGVVDESIITTVWLSIVVSVSFIIISVVITWTCVTKPIKNIASDMKVASSLVGKTQVDRQHLEQICLKWHQHRSSGYGCSANSTHEVALMNQAFAALVYSLSLHDELKAINQAKRKFIRFIFHEVRVPFNALSLAVNQIESDIHLLRKHIAKEGLLHFTSCIDTLHIMSDQTEVVSKILNDVLSMQQIEDGQLKLASEWISIEAIMTAAMNGFGIHCQAKQITMELKSTDLISYIMQQDLSCRQVIEQQKVSNSHLSIGYEVQCDPHRLRQVLANLLSNAIKHTPPNGLITVSLGYENFRPHISQAELDTFATGPIDSIIRLGEISVKIQVFDTGTGITPTAIQHLFDSYNHTYLDPFDIRPGGLGLSITKKLVELFGGTIGVQSRVNYGSVFYFEIPMQVRLRKSPAYTESLPDEDIQITFHDEKSTSHPPTVKLDPVDSFPNNMMPDVKSSLSSTEIVPLGLCPKATYSSSPYIHSRGIEFEKSSPDSLMGHPAHSILPCLPEHKSSHQPLRRRVLVVEDSMPNRKLLMKFLMAIGCDVASVEDGKQCIDLFVQNSPCQFDGIIMDGSMPVMTGVEATRILRERGYAIPIIAVTGNALVEDVDVFMRAGANIVLTKPINKISFTQAVERFIPT